MYEVKLDQFSGPYDLLLQLIEKKNVEITELNLSKVTDQFLSYLENLEHVDSEELADFLIVATKLLYLKSKALLPVVEVEEDADMLEKHLKMYKRFVEAADHIQKSILGSTYGYSRSKAPVAVEIEFSPPPELKGEQLHSTFMSVLKRLEPVVRLPRAVIEKTVSLKERVRQLQQLFQNQQQLSFHTILKESESKSDIIVSFLALLDLVNAKEVKFTQESNFSNIELVHQSSNKH